MHHAADYAALGSGTTAEAIECSEERVRTAGGPLSETGGMFTGLPREYTPFDDTNQHEV